MIDICNLSKVYRLGTSEVPALRSFHLKVENGAFVVIAGPSGSGKSTILSLLGGFERPTSGTIRIGEFDINSLSEQALANWRIRQLGFVFQTFNLLPTLSAYENIEYPLHLKGVPEPTRRQRVEELLRAVGLDRSKDHRPAQLSGGQRQRVAVARALANSPSLLLADEPTANLDHKTGLEIIHLMKEFNRQMGVTLLLATHDSKIINEASRVVELADGEMVRDTACT